MEWKTLRRWGKLPLSEQARPGYLLRLAREEGGLTQKALAEKLGVTQQAVAQAERWTANPTVSYMLRWIGACGQRLSLLLNASIDDLRGIAAGEPVRGYRDKKDRIR